MTGVFTTNWHGLKNRILLNHNYSGVDDRIYNTAGNSVPAYSSATSTIYTPLATLNDSYQISSGRSTIRLGLGENPVAPSENQRDLQGTKWASNNTYVPKSFSSSSITKTGDHTYSRTYTAAIQNSADDTVKVTEFGLFTSVPYTSGSSNYSAEVMIYRGVFDEPITVRHLETVSLTFTISLTLNDV